MMTFQSKTVALDLFKLIIAIILLIIFIVLLLRPAGQNMPASPTFVAAVTGEPFEKTRPSLLPTSVPVATTVAVPVNDTAIVEVTQSIMADTPPSAAFVFTPESTIVPSELAATEPEPPTPIVEPTATLPVLPTPTAETTVTSVEPPSPTVTQASTQAAGAGGEGVCPMPLASRISIGSKVRVLSTLNRRSSPQIGNNVVGASLPGVHLEVLGGPVCTPYQRGAYLWWEVKLPDGKRVWSAEGSLNGKIYFLEPI